jgi:hypothetical protein
MYDIATCEGSSNFLTQVMPSKFIFLNIMPRYNFGELCKFFPKGVVPLKIQTNFKFGFIPDFVIQNPFGIQICVQTKSCSFLFILVP